MPWLGVIIVGHGENCNELASYVLHLEAAAAVQLWSSFPCENMGLVLPDVIIRNPEAQSFYFF